MTLALERPTVTANPETVRDWLRTLHGGSTGHVWVGSDLDRFKGRIWPTTNPSWISQAVDHIVRLDAAGARGIYARTTSLRDRPREGRGGDDDSLTLPGLAADLDIAGPGHKSVKPLPPNPAEAKRIIDESGLPDPSIWVHSGGGLYAWWLLDTPHHIGADLPRIKRLTARWQDPIAHAAETLGYSHGRLGDLARILRIPGTINRKPAMPQPRPCRILQDTGRRYSIANLRDALHDAINAIPTPKPVRLPTKMPPRTADELTPWHDYEARTDWAEILVPHGWSLHSHRGSVRYWTRPDKDRRDGFSASTGRDPARDRLYVFTDATVFEAQRPYVKFDAWATLAFGGDHRAAGRELARLGYGRKEAA